MLTKFIELSDNRVARLNYHYTIKSSSRFLGLKDNDIIPKELWNQKPVVSMDMLIGGKGNNSLDLNNSDLTKIVLTLSSLRPPVITVAKLSTIHHE